MRLLVAVVAVTSILFLTAALLGISALIVPSPEEATVGWTDVTPTELADILDREPVPLVNVHVPYEGELPGTAAFIPYDEIGERLAELPAGPSDPLVLYCRTGRMSEEAARTLAANGYTDLYQLVGGFEAWERDGFELRVDRTRVPSPR